MRPRDNPFAVQRLAALELRLRGIDWPTLLARLDALGRRAAIVAPEGHGKSRLLAALGARLTERGLAVRRAQLAHRERWLGPDRRRALLGGKLGTPVVLLVDGAEQLAPPAWIWLRWRARTAGGLVVTSHRPGLLPTLHAPTTSPELLAELVSELLTRHHDRAGAAPLPSHLPTSGELWQRHRGDLRACLLELYDRCAAAELRPGGDDRGLA